MLQNATRLCDAKFGALFEFADGAFRALSNLNTPPALADFNRELRVWGPHTALGRLAHTRQTVHVEDALADRAYREDAGRKAAVQLGGHTHTPRRADAQGRRAGRRYHHLPSERVLHAHPGDCVVCEIDIKNVVGVAGIRLNRFGILK